MPKDKCCHYLLVGEERIEEIYALYELRPRARQKADEILRILSEHTKKQAGEVIDEELIMAVYLKTKDEPQKTLIWKAIRIIGMELEKEVALHKTK